MFLWQKCAILTSFNSLFSFRSLYIARTTGWQKLENPQVPFVPLHLYVFHTPCQAHPSAHERTTVPVQPLQQTILVKLKPQTTSCNSFAPTMKYKNFLTLQLNDFSSCHILSCATLKKNLYFALCILWYWIEIQNKPS